MGKDLLRLISKFGEAQFALGVLSERAGYTMPALPATPQEALRTCEALAAQLRSLVKGEANGSANSKTD